MKLVTTACSIFFRSKAYCYEALLSAWQHFVVNQDKAVEVAGRRVLLGDHTCAVKDGRKMPRSCRCTRHQRRKVSRPIFAANVGVALGS